MLTAGWLHGGILHIFFNVLWIRQLGPEIANLYGAGRMVIIYTVAGIVGFTLSSVMGLLPIPFFGAPLTVGASASIFGFLGALVHYGRRTGSSHIGQAGLQYALFMGIMGFVFPRRRQRRAPRRIRRRLSRVDDPRSAQDRNASITSLAAVGCLRRRRFAAIIWTVITALPYLR